RQRVEGGGAVADHRVFVQIGVVEHIESGRAVAVRGVDQRQARRRLVGNALEQRTDQVALGVDDANPAARLDVCQREVQQERALAAAGRAEDVNVLAAIRLGEGDGRVPGGVGGT